jgi:hypothetical protein
MIGYPELTGQHPGRWHTTTTAVRLFEAEVLAEVRNVTLGDTESMWVAAITEPDGASGVLLESRVCRTGEIVARWLPAHDARALACALITAAFASDQRFS